MTKYTDKATEFVQTLVGAHESGGSNINISTSWGSPLSDEKVASEKLIKDTIDTKANSSGYTASQNLVTNSSGDIATESKPVIPQPSTTATDIKMNSIQSAGGLNTTTYAKADHVHPSDTSKQDLLVSGTNIKTINGQSLLGSEDITVGVSVGTFTELQTLINTNGITEITLTKDYKYNATTDSSLTSGITIGKNITINGNGHIIDGNDTRRAFYVNGNYILNLNNLIIQNGKTTNGGAIYATNNAQLNINNSTLTNNNATSGGGAIVADNLQVNINNTTLQNNKADYGGAIYATSSSQINITQSIIKNNTATNYANIYCNSATTVYNCDIDNIATTCYNVTNYNYVNENNIANDLTTITSGKVLDARQGKALADMIGDAISYINQ